MNKTIFDKPGTMLYPLPAVMVSCGDTTKGNILTVSWTGTVNSEPPMVYISVRKSRYSHELITRTGEFAINLTTANLAFATDFCGVRSGRDIDKFEAMGLTAFGGIVVKCPLIKEAPVNLECKVVNTIELPSHDMFIADVVAVHADSELFNESGKLELEKAGLLCYSHGSYYSMLDESLGQFGYSVMKPKTKKRIQKNQR
jgi:flavin reductase (DIM6/NTAB) family NADH-FMN oxidoreductase RutF